MMNLQIENDLESEHAGWKTPSQEVQSALLTRMSPDVRNRLSPSISKRIDVNFGNIALQNSRKQQESCIGKLKINPINQPFSPQSSTFTGDNRSLLNHLMNSTSEGETFKQMILGVETKKRIGAVQDYISQNEKMSMSSQESIIHSPGRITSLMPAVIRTPRKSSLTKLRDTDQGLTSFRQKKMSKYQKMLYQWKKQQKFVPIQRAEKSFRDSSTGFEEFKVIKDELNFTAQEQMRINGQQA